MDDIQSWWEVPSIAHFCSLFRAAFNLLDFDIEELEEALLTDGTEDTGSSLLQELIVRLLCGCYGRNHGISIFNYQMFLRRLFRTKCREVGRENPFDSDVDFQFLPLRTKVTILQALCDFRLDADDVLDCLKNLESDSLRLQPLGYDRNQSAYWYFYGTRLYREDYPKVKKKEAPPKRGRKRIRPLEPHEEEPELELDLGAGVWQVVCYTEEDWSKLAEGTQDATCKQEKTLHHVLVEDFLPEIPRLFEEKRNLQRKRLMEMAPRRQSTRIEKLKHSKEIERKLQKQKEEDFRRQQEEEERMEEEWRKHKAAKERQKRIENRERGSRSNSEDRWTTEDNSSMCSYQTSTGGFAASSGGRKTNNSLSAAMGEMLMPPLPPPSAAQPANKKLKSSHSDGRSREDDLRVGMHKIMGRLKSHEDAWPFCEPVDESTAPNYYAKIKRPMDLTRMEEKLDEGAYVSFEQFEADFQQIVDNCRKYNGLDNEYTDMVRRLQQIFRDAVARYVDRSSGSEDEDQYPPLSVPTPPKKRGRKKKIVLSPRSLTPTDEEEDKENEEKSGTIPSNSDSEREREEVESIKSLSNEPKPPKRRRGRPSKERPNNIPKNSSAAIEALELVTEQTLKDINKWLDDTPRFSEYPNSASNSPSQILGIVEDYESRARIEAEYQRTLSKIDKIDKAARKEALQQKRRLMKEQQAAASALLHPTPPPPPPVKKKREIQRTIERLQPGKSKGNLLSNTQNVSSAESSTSNPLLPLSKIREKEKAEVEEKTEPQLSLGTVLTSDVIGFGIGPKQHSFGDAEADSSQGSKDKEEGKDEAEDEPETEKEEEKVEEKEEEKLDKAEGKEADVEEERAVSPVPTPAPPPAKETKPNFNAWFKAFGAPKVVLPTGKRKLDVIPRDSPDDTMEEISDLPPPTPGRGLGLERHRRLSTGSSVSESGRSSLSQEPADPAPSPLEPYASPQQGHSPYHHSPSSAAPIKVGFYQDTFPRAGSDKSSSCSPRDPPSNQNSPHLQIVSPVQSPKEPNVYSNPLSPYVYDVPPPTPSYPSHTRDVPYYERPPVYAVAPASPPPPPSPVYPVKKRIYAEEQPPSPSPQPPPLSLQHQRLMEHYSSLALHAPYASTPDPPPKSPSPSPHSSNDNNRFTSLTLHPPYTNNPDLSKSPAPPHGSMDNGRFSSLPLHSPYTNNPNLPKSPSPTVSSNENARFSSRPLHSPFSNNPDLPKSQVSAVGSNDNSRFSSLALHPPYTNNPIANAELSKTPAPAHSSNDNTPLNYSNYAMSDTGYYNGPKPPTSHYEHLNKSNSQYENLPKSASQYEHLTKPTSQYEHLTKPPTSQYEHLSKPTSQYEHIPKPPTSQYEHLSKPPMSQFEHLPKPPTSQFEHLPKPPNSQYEHLSKPPTSQFEHLSKPPTSQYEHLSKPPTSQYEHLMSHFNSSSPAADLGYSMYLKNTPGNYPPLNFPQHRPAPVFSNPATNYHNKPLPNPSTNYVAKPIANPSVSYSKPPEEMTPAAKKPAAKKPRKKKGQEVPSISSGSNTAFQQYLGQSPIVPSAPAGYSYSYLEEMRNSGYYLPETGAPNVKGPPGSPFSFGRSTPHAPQPNYSLAQYQQYLMLGYSPGYLPPPHDRPPWPL